MSKKQKHLQDLLRVGRLMGDSFIELNNELGMTSLVTKELGAAVFHLSLAYEHYKTGLPIVDCIQIGTEITWHALNEETGQTLCGIETDPLGMQIRNIPNCPACRDQLKEK